MTIDEKLKSLGIQLPPFNKAAANYESAIKSGSLIFTAGQTPKINGDLQYKGKLDNSDISLGKEAARLCALNCLSIIEASIGSLDNIVKIVKVTGYVNATPEFTQHAKVIDGATDILVELFGDKGRPARSSVGVSSLPGDAMCEVEMIVEVIG